MSNSPFQNLTLLIPLTKQKRHLTNNHTACLSKTNLCSANQRNPTSKTPHYYVQFALRNYSGFGAQERADADIIAHALWLHNPHDGFRIIFRTKLRT